MYIRSIIFICLIGKIANAQKTDTQILENLNIGRNTSVDKGLYVTSKSADVFAIGTPVALIGLGFLRNDASLKKKGINAALSGIGTYGIAYALKESIKRNRPYINNTKIQNYKTENGYSFPSGSTSSAFSTATTLSLSYPKWYVIVPAYAYASTVGYSRLHLGAHYPSDVIAGALIGSSTAILSRQLNKLVTNTYRKRQLRKTTWEE